MMKMKNIQHFELIMTYSSIPSTEYQLNIHSTKFRNCLFITKITRIIYYKNLVLYGSKCSNLLFSMNHAKCN